MSEEREVSPEYFRAVHLLDEIKQENAALLVSLANETRRRKAAEDERDQHEAEWSAELATLRAELTAARERAIEEAAALCDTALKTIPPKSDAAAEVLHLAGRIRALAGRKGEG